MNQKNTKVQNGGAGGPGGPRGVPMGKPEEIKKTIGRVFGYLKGFRLHMTIVAICLLVNAASSIACTYFLKPLFNNFIGPLIGQQNPDLSEFARILVLMGMLYCLAWWRFTSKIASCWKFPPERFTASGPTSSPTWRSCPFPILIPFHRRHHEPVHQRYRYAAQYAQPEPAAVSLFGRDGCGRVFGHAVFESCPHHFGGAHAPYYAEDHCTLR